MPLPIDATGVSSANFVLNEPHLTSTIFTNQYGTIYPNEGPFYKTRLVLRNTNTQGITKLLVLDVDYKLIYPLPGIRASSTNEVFGGIRIISDKTNGVIEIAYQALGGNWTYDQAQINDYQLANYYNPNTYFPALVPNPEVYSANMAISLESFAKIQASFVLVETIRLGVTYKQLSLIEVQPNNNTELAQLIELLANGNASAGTPSNAVLNQGILILSAEPTIAVPPTIKYVVQLPDPARPGGYFVSIFKTTHGIVFVHNVTVTQGDRFVTAEIKIDLNGTIFVYGNVSLDNMIVRIQ